jgi:hypothetical protein
VGEGSTSRRRLFRRVLRRVNDHHRCRGIGANDRHGQWANRDVSHTRGPLFPRLPRGDSDCLRHRAGSARKYARCGAGACWRSAGAGGCAPGWAAAPGHRRRASRATRLGQLSAVVIVHRHHPVRLAGPGDEPRDGDDGADPCVVLGVEVDRADAADKRDHPSADALADTARRLRPRLRPRPTPVPALRGRAGAATWRRARVSGQPISPSHGARPQ